MRSIIGLLGLFLSNFVIQVSDEEDEDELLSQTTGSQGESLSQPTGSQNDNLNPNSAFPRSLKNGNFFILGTNMFQIFETCFYVFLVVVEVVVYDIVLSCNVFIKKPDLQFILLNALQVSRLIYFSSNFGSLNQPFNDLKISP